jgi:hypothetical protein
MEKKRESFWMLIVAMIQRGMLPDLNYWSKKDFINKNYNRIKLQRE